MFKEINIFLCKQRSFCFGVENALKMLDCVLDEFGAPIYVYHEIVHNKHIVEGYETKGVIFVDDIKDIDQTRPIIFSAHGVSKEIVNQAKNLNIKYFDATCPLVLKIHKKIIEFERNNFEIILIGKKNHDEVIGTVGQLQNKKNIHIIYSLDDAKKLDIDRTKKIGFVTQTTLSIDETKDIIKHLKDTYPNIESLSKSDICLATSTRQEAIKNIAPMVEMMIVIGSKNSSNSKKLQEVALKNGVKNAILIDDVSEIDFKDISQYNNIGISAGASAPEYLVQNLIEEFSKHYKKINIQEI